MTASPLCVAFFVASVALLASVHLVEATFAKDQLDFAPPLVFPRATKDLVTIKGEAHAYAERKLIHKALTNNWPVLFVGPISEKAKQEILFAANGSQADGARTRLPIYSHGNSSPLFSFADRNTLRFALP